ncbi:hypothetical protein Glove_99g275 [Diversispora epigaea]|uniref:SWIM-type domain-containing protein n=1 Tax=Diversispora epigaea TaxID=1348612 RepID=A0A397J4E8_9GLOM|nr:hypothetical protein Glove_99g275 [Diversispora epigaea]
MKEIEFLTVQYKMGASTQRQYLEAKFPGQIIYNNDLYCTIQYFHPQSKNDTNDAAKLYTRLLELSLHNPMWKVAIKFDDNNTLTHLFWMSPSQLELWYQFSDIVVQNVTCKTNRYDMALSLFVILDENQNIRLIAQALLIDETKESHEWTFKQINLATDNLYPQVIMTDADPAVHAAIRSTFLTTYPMHCTFHIGQNLIKKLQRLLGQKFQEFLSKFYIVRLHASSPIESINAWIKGYIFNSNISLCELGDIIDKRQSSEDKNHQLILWKATIPCTFTQISTAAFMFTSINKKLEEYLPPAILKFQKNEIHQSVFYDAYQINQETINEFEEVYLPDARQITASCMIADVNKEQISSIWTVSAPLYKGKIFNTWQEAFDTIESWAKKQGFNRTVQCEHQSDYVTKSTSKQTTTKRIGCTWHINLSEPIAENSFNHISTAAFMFTSINKKLEEYLPPAILKFQKNEIHQSVFYDAYQINQETINEFEEVYLPDARQITASCMIADVNKEQISSIWTVSVGNKLMEKHFIILLTNGSHYCSCLSLINREIVCRHYFQIMLRSSLAKFHLRLIPSRWYYKNKDPSKEPFLVANKFEDENAPIIPESNIPFLAAVNQTTMPDSISNHERLTDIQLYGKITGLTHKVTMKIIRNKDICIIDILENYLQDENENVDENINNISEHIEDLESDKENNSSVLKNPNRQTKPKGRPKGTKRLKAFHEKTNTISLGVNKQYKCGNCDNTGHNKRNCDQI